MVTVPTLGRTAEPTMSHYLLTLRGGVRLVVSTPEAPGAETVPEIMAACKADPQVLASPLAGLYIDALDVENVEAVDSVDPRTKPAPMT